jgi:ribosomal-protein-alanine N-acetyltransferase
MPFPIKTPHLLIREVLPTDDLGMLELDTDPEVHKYVGKNPITTIEQARETIAFVRQQYIDLGIGRWAVINRADNDFLGWAGFKLITEPTNNHINHYDFGYRFIRRCWNQGIGTEASIACLNYGIKELHLKNIYAMTDPENTASRHLLEKLGFKFIELFQFETNPGWRTDDNLTTTWYKLPEEAYKWG